MKFEAIVRTGDPADRQESEDAHEVRILVEGNSGRTVGIWGMKHQADEVAAVLNKWAGRQIR
jgi:phosphoglycerate dehydrogenase-like enzyme